MPLLPLPRERNRREYAMKLNSAQVEQTLSQFEAQVLPEDPPMVPELNELFGDHTFFLNIDGLNVVEPNEDAVAGARTGTVVNLANWTDAHLTNLVFCLIHLIPPRQLLRAPACPVHSSP